MIELGRLKRLVGFRAKSKARILIDPLDVYFFEYKDGDVCAHLEGEALTIRSSLHEILEQLDPVRFAQTHKSFIINLDKVERIEPLSKENYTIILKWDKQDQVPLSRKHVSGLRQLISAW